MALSAVVLSSFSNFPELQDMGVSLRYAPGRASRAVGHDTTVSDCAGPAPPQTAVTAPSRPCGRESLTHSHQLRAGYHRAQRDQRNPSPRRPLPHALRFLQCPPFARCAGVWSAGLRETLKVPAPVAPQPRLLRAPAGFFRWADVTGCARRNGFRHNCNGVPGGGDLCAAPAAVRGRVSSTARNQVRAAVRARPAGALRRAEARAP
jgi:hypothetical protein